jgi:glycosyl transferase family 1
VVWVFLGSDHRPAYLSGRAARADGPQGIAGVLAESRRRKARVELAERHADWIVALPASAQFHSRPFVHFLRMGIPFAAADDEGGAHPFVGSGVRILHAPSDPLSKGTDAIRGCIDRLRAEGHAVDYVEVTGRPHRDVVAAIRACDLVVDEVYSDTPMAVLGTEAAFFGKPTVVTGYFAPSIRAELRADLTPPTAFDLPDQLDATIRRLVVDEVERRQLGERARRFVQEQWSPERVAERFMRLIDDDVPPDWMVMPDGLRYVHGWGLREEDSREAVNAVLDAGGPEALLLDRQPSLRDRLIRFARGAA